MKSYALHWRKNSHPCRLCMCKAIGLFCVHPPAMSRSPQIKIARWPKTELSEWEEMNWETTTLQMQLRGGVRVQSAVSAWGRLGVINAQAHLIGERGVTVWLAKACLSMRVPRKTSKRLASLRRRLIAHERAVGCSLGGCTCITLKTESHAHLLTCSHNYPLWSPLEHFKLLRTKNTNVWVARAPSDGSLAIIVILNLHHA